MHSVVRLSIRPSAVLSSLVVILAVSNAHAQVAVTGSIGTTGLGLHLTSAINPSVNVRVGFNALNYSHSGSTDDADYDVDLKLNTFDALIDYYPAAGGQFRLTGGLVYNNNKFDIDAKSTNAGTYTLNGRTYTAANIGTISGRGDFRKIAPYLGIGWGNAMRATAGWSVGGDLGVMFQGSARSSLSNNGCTAPGTICNDLASDLVAENRQLRDDLNDFKVYPVVRIGVSYRF